MRYALLAGLATAGVIAASAASAMPLSNLATTVQDDQGGILQVGRVCNTDGRCWDDGNRRSYGSYAQRRYYAPRRHYAPRYGYYGNPYRRGHGYGEPGIGFNFRF